MPYIKMAKKTGTKPESYKLLEARIKIYVSLQRDMISKFPANNIRQMLDIAGSNYTRLQSTHETINVVHAAMATAAAL